MTDKEALPIMKRILPDRYECSITYNGKLINGVHCFDKSYKGVDEEQWGYIKKAAKQNFDNLNEFYHHQCTNHIEFEVRLKL